MELNKYETDLVRIIFGNLNIYEVINILRESKTTLKELDRLDEISKVDEFLSDIKLSENIYKLFLKLDE